MLNGHPNVHSFRFNEFSMCACHTDVECGIYAHVRSCKAWKKLEMQTFIFFTLYFTLWRGKINKCFYTPTLTHWRLGTCKANLFAYNMNTYNIHIYVYTYIQVTKLDWNKSGTHLHWTCMIIHHVYIHMHIHLCTWKAWKWRNALPLRLVAYFLAFKLSLLTW